MQTASSASRTWRAPRSASEKTATVRSSSWRQAGMTRTAISPRLAMSSLLNTSACLRLRTFGRQPSSFELRARLPHGEAAVHVEDLARDVAGVLPAEEDAEGGDLFRRPEAAHRDAVEEPLADVVAEVTGQAVVDEARGDGVDGDAPGGDLPGQGHGEAEEAGLGRRVIGLAGVAGAADD